eukprot:gene13392-17956_t
MGFSNPSVAGYVGVMLIAVFVLSLLIVVYYAEPGFPWHTYVTTVSGYYASFAIMLLVPIDIASIVVDRRSNLIGIDTNYNQSVQSLSVAYDVFFTLILILGSVVLVFEEYYNTDGYFTLGGKLASSFKRMCWDLALGAVAGGVILGILIGKKVVPADGNALKLSAVIVTNTVYEAMLMFLLGYALVEFPRSIWNMSDLNKYLLATQTKASMDFKAISDAEFEIGIVVANVIKTKAQVDSYGDAKLTQAMELLRAECPPEFRSDRQGKVVTNKSGQVTIDTLANLRTELNMKKDRYKMSQAKVEVTKVLAYRLEDMVRAFYDGSGVIHWSLTGTDSTNKEFLWYIKVKPILLKIAALLAGLMSILSFLGVVCSMTGVRNEVSVYFLATHDSQATVGGITVFILFTFGYTVYITSWAIFQMRLSGLMELVPMRTTPESLSFNVRAIARFAAPLAFFYLGWIAENGIKSGTWNYNNAPSIYENVTITVINNSSIYNTTHIHSYEKNVTMLVSQSIFMPSAFSKFYQLERIGAIQKAFGTFFPILLFCVLFLFAINAFNRILVMCKLDNYQFGAAIVTDEELREGKRQLERHRKRTERTYRRQGMKNLLLRVEATVVSSVGGNSRNGFFARLFGDSKAPKKDEEDPEASFAKSIREPNELSGPFERKATNHSIMGSNWKESYGIVKSPGFLQIYKDKKSSAVDNSATPGTSADGSTIIIDLRLVVGFKVPVKKNKDDLELDIELADETTKIRFKSAEEVEKWRTGLMEWKDFNLDYGTMYPNGLKSGPIATEGVRISFQSGNNGRESDIEKGSATLRPSGSGASGINKSNSQSSALMSAAVANNELANVNVEDDDEDDNGVRPLMKGLKFSTSSFSGGLFGSKGRKSETGSKTITKVVDNKPMPLEGWLEKKGHGKIHVGADWQKRYLRVVESSASVNYYKSSDPKESPAGVIELRFVQEISSYDKSNRGSSSSADNSRFNIDTGDKVFKFKASNDNEGQKWVDGLNQWREYFLLNM